MGLTKINRANLSKSIVLHHNKLNSLLSTVGRYNDIIGRQDIDNVDENDEEYLEDQGDDDGVVNNDSIDNRAAKQQAN
jgi:hypothetical protein